MYYSENNLLYNLTCKLFERSQCVLLGYITLLSFLHMQNFSYKRCIQNYFQLHLLFHLLIITSIYSLNNIYHACLQKKKKNKQTLLKETSHIFTFYTASVWEQNFLKI